MLPQTLLTGQAGVWRVAAELALRGIQPSFPGVDYGYDLLLEGGIRIQVKATHWVKRKAKIQEGYWFHLRRSATAHGNNRITTTSPRVFSQRSDFVVLHGIDDHRFWVVPSGLLDNWSLVVIGNTNPMNSEVSQEEVFALRALGLTQQNIADVLKTTTSIVHRRLSGRTPSGNITMTQRVRKYEDAWGLVAAMVDSKRQHEVEFIGPRTLPQLLAVNS